MFLYLLNDKEGKAFLELAVQAMNLSNPNSDCEKAEYETYLAELNLPDYKITGLSLEKAAAVFKSSDMPVKRAVIIELCSILYADKEIDTKEMDWIHALSDILQLNRIETEKLMRWSKDFSDFIEIGLMYINA